MMTKMKDYSGIIKITAYLVLTCNIAATIVTAVIYFKAHFNAWGNLTPVILYVAGITAGGLLVSLVSFSLLIGFAQLVNNSEARTRVAMNQRRLIYDEYGTDDKENN